MGKTSSEALGKDRLVVVDLQLIISSLEDQDLAIKATQRIKTASTKLNKWFSPGEVTTIISSAYSNCQRIRLIMFLNLL